MAPGERASSGGTRGIARFLAEHQHCDAGFDVRREDEPGSGRLRITCLGCGQTIAYKAADAAEPAAAGLDGPNSGAPVEPVAPAPLPAPVGPPAGGMRRVAGATGRPAATRPGAPRRGLPGWIPVLLIGGLILGGLAMIAIGLTRSNEEGTGSGAGTTPAETQPAPAQQGAPGSEQPSEPAPAAPEAGDSAAGGSAALQKRTFLGRFEIGVPSGWRSGKRGDVVTLRAAGAVAVIRIVTQKGEFSDGVLSEGAADFLAGQHPEARIGEPGRVRIRGRRATRVRATYPGGEESAYALSAGGYSFLIGERVERGASQEIERAARAAVDSFEPR